MEGLYELSINTPYMIGYELGLNEEPIGFKRSSVECSACKWGSWLFRNTVGSDLAKDFIVGFAKAACPFVMQDLSGFVPSTCNGILDS